MRSKFVLQIAAVRDCLTGYVKGCPSPAVDLLLVLDPKHNDIGIRREGDAAHSEAAVNR
jgi:hypothetical protein